MVNAPRFSRRFRRLCHVAALAGTDRLRTVLDGLLPVVMVYDDGPWRGANDWVEAIEELFGLHIAEADVMGAVDRATGSGVLVFNNFRQEYGLSATARASTLERIEVGEKLEREAQESWLRDINGNLGEVPSNSLWDCLLKYTGKMLLQHGAAAVELFAGRDDMADVVDDPPSAILKDAMEKSGLDVSLYANVAASIVTFFDGKSAIRTQYVVELADSMFSFYSLGVDDDTREVLAATLPNLAIFVDTNVIFGVIGAHQAPSAAAASDLFRIIRENGLPFKLYYHEKTLNELERTIGGIGDRLRGRRWTPAISRALLGVPYAISSIEVKFHELNATTPTSPDVFLSRYSSLPGLLADQGLTIYRDAAASSESEVTRRGSLVAEYKEFAKRERPKDREKPYSALDHDVSIWLAALSRRTATSKAPLFAGSMILSADRLFQRFERESLAPDHSDHQRLIVFPNTLMQALRPFVAATRDFDQTFMSTFASAEFRGIASGSEEAVTAVAAYLATYADLPEETATRILSNSVLMAKVRGLTEKSDEFKHFVDDALVRENEALTRERDAAQSAVKQARAEAESIAARLSEEALKSDAKSSSLENRLVQVEAAAQESERALRAEINRQASELARLARERDAATRRRRLYATVAGSAAFVAASVAFTYVWPPRWLATHPSRLGLLASVDVAVVSALIGIVEHRGRWVSVGVLCAAVASLLTVISRTS